MGGGSAFWIRKGARDPADWSWLVGTWRDVVDDGAFVRIENDDEAPRQLLASLSEKLGTTIVWLAYQSATDSLDYIHHHDGSLVREIRFGMNVERVWEKLVGSPEAWESWSEPPKHGAIGSASASHEADRILVHHGIREAPAKETATTTAPKKPTPKEAVPQKAIPKKAMPPKDMPTKAAPKEARPTKAAPKEAEPAKAALKKTMPTKAMPTKGVPKKAIPKAAMPKKPSPKDAPPKKSLPKKAPVKKASRKSAVQKTPVAKAPAVGKPAPKKVGASKVSASKRLHEPSSKKPT